MSLILVSNRLPISIRRTKGSLQFDPNPGGLAAGLGSFYRQLDSKWFGWPGEVPAADQKRVAARLREQFDCHAVFLPSRLVREYYSGFSNGVLWPLLHSFPSYATFRASEWEAYRQANERFAEAIAKAVSSKDVVWIHDYHLFLLPEVVRRRLPDARIGFFLHTPFPPHDVLRVLPRYREILRGVLGADLIGFHTYEYQRAFLEGVRRTFGLDDRMGTVQIGQRVVGVDVFPLGIDVARFAAGSVGPSFQRTIERLRKGLGDSKLLFSVSRLDYTKGIPQQLQSFRRFLEVHPEWRGKVTYLLAVVPSREKVARYAQLKREIDEQVSRINSEYGTLAWTPIRYLYRQLHPEELLALYRTSDVALLTPLRDGMNLIAKEYVASRTDAGGVLILSEMAGASKELLEALVVNPYDAEEVADAIAGAVTMPTPEQARRLSVMQDRLRRSDVRTWPTHFLNRLDAVRRITEDLAVRIPGPRDPKAFRQAYRSARHRCILLDYDGTLVPFASDRASTEPDPRVLELLKILGSREGNTVVLISGRPRSDLDRWFGELPLTLIAEHGGWVKRPAAAWESALPPDDRWKERVRPILDQFVERIPGSSVEEKDFSLAWHYRAADRDTGAKGARDLSEILTLFTTNPDLQVLPGSKVIEIRRRGVNKGTYFATDLAKEPWDFIFAAGDDWTDEALFEVLPGEAISIRVGLQPSAARFNVERPDDLVAILEGLVK